MGIKSVYAVIGLAVVSSLLYTISVMLPMHKMPFYTYGGFKHLATMNTHMVWIEFPVGRSSFCEKMFDSATTINESVKKEAKKAKKAADDWCDHLEGTHEIQDVALHLCTPAVQFLWPEFCHGLEQAHGFGIALIITMVTSAIMQGVGAFFLYDYMTRKANPKYKEIGLSLLGVAALLMALTIALYGIMVVSNLDTVGGPGWLSVLLTAGKEKGFAGGYVVLCVACALQCVQLLFYPWLESEWAEDDYLDAKYQKDLARENGEYGTFGGAQAPAPAVGGFGMQPAGAVMVTMQPVAVTGVAVAAPGFGAAAW